MVLHGLWMRPMVMRLLAFRLRRHGFSVYLFGYPSRRGSLANHASWLEAWLRIQFVPGQPLHFVGHSLGGVVLRALATQNPCWFGAGRTVFLGAPHQGSQAATRVARWTIGRWWLGEAGQELAGQGVSELAVPAGELGGIAGTRPRWITRWCLDGPNDGLVRVAETELPGVQSRLVPVSHMGLLYTRCVAEATAEFLSQGQFPQG